MARPLLAMLALAAVALAPLAVAQVPPQAPTSPVVTLKVDVPKGPQAIELGASNNVTVTVTFSVSNIVCPTAQLPAGASPGTAVVKLTANEKPSPLNGITSMLTPSQLQFNLTSGQYASPGFSGSGSAILHYTVAKSTMPDHDHAFNVTATFDGTITNCQSLSGSIPSAVASGEHQIKTGKAPQVVVSGTTLPPGQTAPATTSKKSPSVGIPLLALAAVALVVLRRR